MEMLQTTLQQSSPRSMKTKMREPEVGAAPAKRKRQRAKEVA